jgi:hypothetical protein
MFPAPRVSLETTHILSEAFPDGMDNKRVIQGDMLSGSLCVLHNDWREVTPLGVTVT